MFFPLIYWPMTVRQQMLSEKALSRIDAYMKNGGTILFDTRDQLTNFNLGREGERETGPRSGGVARNFKIAGYSTHGAGGGRSCIDPILLSAA